MCIFFFYVYFSWCICCSGSSGEQPLWTALKRFTTTHPATQWFLRINLSCCILWPSDLLTPITSRGSLSWHPKPDHVETLVSPHWVSMWLLSLSSKPLRSMAITANGTASRCHVTVLSTREHTPRKQSYQREHLLPQYSLENEVVCFTTWLKCALLGSSI